MVRTIGLLGSIARWPETMNSAGAVLRLFDLRRSETGQ